MASSTETWKAITVPPAPPASSPAARAVFLSNKRRDTRPEIELRSALHTLGLRFLVDATPSGVSRRRRADVLLRGSRIAILVHGCFWHCCPEHFSMPKTNADWWGVKFEAIRHRDRDTLEQIQNAGWLPQVVWEHEDMTAAAHRIRDLHYRAVVLGSPALTLGGAPE